MKRFTVSFMLGLLASTSGAACVGPYTYDNSAYLSGITDGTNSMSYTARTAAGLPLAADFNGTQIAWQYQYQKFVSQMTYATQVWFEGRMQPLLLAEWDANYDPSGLRRSLANWQLHEVTNYDYDQASRLAQETRYSGSGTTTTAYTYDQLGNRLSKSVKPLTLPCSITFAVRAQPLNPEQVGAWESSRLARRIPGTPQSPIFLSPIFPDFPQIECPVPDLPAGHFGVIGWGLRCQRGCENRFAASSATLSSRVSPAS